jgi:hypothetical protein
MLHPGPAEVGGGEVLAGGGVPEFHRPVLAAGGQQALRGMPGEGIGAVVMAGQVGGDGPVRGGVHGDRAGGRGGGEEGAVGRPAEIDHVVVECHRPVFADLHGGEVRGVVAVAQGARRPRWPG